MTSKITSIETVERKLYFDEIYQEFYDYADKSADPDRKTPQAGDLVHTYAGKHPTHRTAIVNALSSRLGLALTEEIDNEQEWAEVIEE